MSSRNLRVLGMIAAALLLLGTGMAQAVDYTWTQPTPGTYNWESNNWSVAESYPNGAEVNAFLATNGTTWNMTSPSITLGSLAFGTGGNTIKGTKLVFDNGSNHATLSRGDVGTTNGASMQFTTIRLNSTLDVNITSHLTSAVDVTGTFEGPGGLNIIRADGDAGWVGFSLHGAQTYTGGTTVGAGATLSLNAEAGSGKSITGGVVLGGSGANLRINYTPDLKSQGTLLGGAITGTGTVMTDGNVIFDNNDNSWQGGLQLTGNFPPPVKFTSIGNVGEMLSDGVTKRTTALGSPQTAAQGTIRMQGGGSSLEYIGSGDTTDRIIEMNCFGDFWTTTINASGTTTVASPFKITSNLAGSGTGWLILGGTGAGEWAGNLGTNASRIQKNDAGTWTLSGTNTYTGVTQINTGTLIAGKPASLPGYATGSVTLANNATLAVRADGTSDTWQSGDIDGLLATTIYNSNNKFGIQVPASASYTHSSGINGPQGFAKLGGGTLVLAGANNYSGATTVNAGTLVIGSAGSIASSSGVSIGAGEFTYNNTTTPLAVAPTFSATGGTLSGTGKISVPVTITSGNTLSLGDGTLTLGGLTLDTGAKVKVTNPDFSLAQVNGNYNDSLGTHVLVVSGTMTTGTSYKFLQWTGDSGSLTDGEQSNWGFLTESGSTVKNWIGTSAEDTWTNALSWDGDSGSVTANKLAGTMSFTPLGPGGAPSSVNEVVIDPAVTSDIKITGPASSAAVNSLQVGGPNGKSPTLTLGTGQLTVAGAVNVLSTGTLNATGGALVAPTLNLSGAAVTLGHASGNVTTANITAGTLTVDAGTVGTANLSGTGSLAGTQAIAQVNVTGGTPTFSGNATAMTVTGGTLAFNSTQVNGTLTLPAGSTGTVNVGPAVGVNRPTVTTADFSKGAGTVMASNPLTITSTLKLADNITASIAGASSFSVKGNNIVDNEAARTFTFSGGTLKLTKPGGFVLPTVGSVPSFWLDASDASTMFTDTAGTTPVTDGGQAVARWNSKAGGYSMQQSTAANQPAYRTAQAQGNSIVDFGVFHAQDGQVTSNGKYMYLYSSSGAQTELNLGNSQNTIFWIVKGSNFLLGNSNSYDFHRGVLSPTGNIWDSGWADGSIKNGTTYLNKVAVNGTTTGLTGGSTYDLVDLKTTGTGTARFNALALEREYRSGGMQYGEILVFPGALGDTDRQAVENYLEGKWITGVGAAAASLTLANTNIAVTASSVPSVLDLGAGDASHTLGNLSLNNDGTVLTISNAASVSFNNVTGSLATRVNSPAPLTVRGALTPAGQMTVNGDLILASTATTTLNIDGAGAYDWVSVNGNALTLDGTLNVTLSGTFAGSGTYDLFNNIDTVYSPLSTEFANVNLQAAPGEYSWENFGTVESPKYIKYDAASGRVYVSLVAPAPTAFHWVGGQGTGWIEGANWGGSAPNAPGAVAYVGESVGYGAIDVGSANKTVGSLTMAVDQNTTISSSGDGKLVFQQTDPDAKALLSAAGTDQQITAPVTLANSLDATVSTGKLTITGNIDGAGALTLTSASAGTLVLSSTLNTYGGGTTVSGGTLVIGSAGALPAGKSLSIGSGGTLILGGGMAMGQAASAEPVPEPGTLALLAIAALAGVMIWRRK